MLIVSHVFTALALLAFATAIYVYFKRSDHGGKMTEMIAIVGAVLLFSSIVIRWSLAPVP
ncbi:hypothetical protein IKF12_01505 [Candidatus Saccharibacteria bacterium]|nr:hypothetical protein [Candidatus Saccharibacteria bacterium]